MKIKSILFLALTLLFTMFSAFSQNEIWKKSHSKGSLNSLSIDKLDNKHYKILQVNEVLIKQNLKDAPLRGVKSIASPIVLRLPNEKGTFETFKIFEAPVFSPELSAKYPDIKSYVGFSIDKSKATLRMSVSPRGISTMIDYKDKPTVFMQPVTGDKNNYIVYNKLSRANNPLPEFVCSTTAEYVKEQTQNKTSKYKRDADDQLLRKFRLAISVNGEYSVYHGGTVAGALAAINASMTRVNAVFETDMAVTFELVNANQLIYLNPATDPYSDTLTNWNEELQTTLSTNLGSANYDIGHLFGGSGGGGNAGCIGCVCDDTINPPFNKGKGSGITSPSDGIPEGDAFDIDYVAHEIGHQMGANHTWAFASEGTGVNVEPGSGTTIMGYAGIVGPNNVQQNSDPYFHYYSIKQVLDNLDTAPNNCAVKTAISNAPPVANAGNDYNIPQGTAYVLKGTATDPNGGDTLTYCWEQIDDGIVTNSNFGPTQSLGGMNRSLEPTSNSNRYIPKFSRVIAGELTQDNPIINDDWETVSTIPRDLNWALTVRDKAPSATGLNGQSSFDLMKITVEGGDAFTMNTPVALPPGGSGQVTWNLGASTNATINCNIVTIKLSTDGGLTFPIILASNVPNDGVEMVNLPAMPDSTTARLIVEAADNIFYAMSDNFIISSKPAFSLNNFSGSQTVCYEDTVVYNLGFSIINGFSETTTFSVTGNPVGSSVVFSPATLNSSGTFTMTLSGLAALAAGVSTLQVTGTSASVTSSIGNIELNSVDGICPAAGTNEYQTSTTGVVFNTITNLNNEKPSGYNDYTFLTTDITRESDYDLTVNMNTDGDFACVTKVWIDWNQNCILETSEEYDLGTGRNIANGPSSNSPLSITVPADAVLGNTIMRVNTKYELPSTSCETEFDGEVEDYTVNVLAPLSVVNDSGLDSQLFIYPNPNTGLFNVKLSNIIGDKIDILIYDVRGREVYKKQFNNMVDFNVSININAIESGLYILRVLDVNSAINTKILIE